MMTTLQFLGSFVICFFAGYGLCWLMDWQTMRRMREDARFDANEIAKLKEHNRALCGEQMQSHRVRIVTSRN